jgi:hypothetical protein
VNPMYEMADDRTRSIKKWKCPEGTFVHNFPGHEAIINTLSVNEDGVLFSGGQYIGRLCFCFVLTRTWQATTDHSRSGTTRRVNRSST